MTNKLIRLRNSVLAGMFSLVAVSCSDVTDDGVLPDGKYPMFFTATVDGEAVSRATTDTDGNTSWQIDDRVAISKDGSDSYKEYRITDVTSGAMSPNGDGLYWSQTTETLAAWHPIGCTIGSGSGSNEVPITDQSSGFGELENILHAPAADYTYSSGGAVNFTFRHALAKVSVTLQKEADKEDFTDEEISGATVTFMGYTQGTLGYDGLTTTDTGEKNGEINPKVETPTDGTAKTYTALLIPQQMQNEKFIKVTIGSGADARDYFYTPTAENDANLESGYLYKYIITVKKTGLSVVAQSISDWDGESEEVDGTILNVLVHATGDKFTPEGGGSAGSSTEGYTTQFAEGDEIGVFAVKDGRVMDNCKNVKLTYNGERWVEGIVYHYEDAKYFAYYPYDAAMNDKTKVDDIITALKAKLQLQTDQSTLEKFKKSGLMTAKDASPTENKELHFQFEHQMSLIEIALPWQKCRTPDDYGYSSPVIHAEFSITFAGGQQSVTPYNMGGVYRYIVPGNGSYTVSGEYWVVGDETNAKPINNVTINNLPVGNYHREDVTDTGSETPIERALQVGDFYYSDGNIVPVEVVNPPQEGCIGIVMKVGRERDGQWADNDNYRDKDGKSMDVHGYVLALHDGNGGGRCAWGLYTEVGTKQSESDTHFCGYSNTRLIKDKAEELKEELQLTFPNLFPAAYYASEGYERQYPSPRNSSGWFLPSAGQCLYWFDQSGPLKISMDKVVRDEWQDYYWSSSESSLNPEVNAWYVDFIEGFVLYYRKDYAHRNGVRPCLAF